MAWSKGPSATEEEKCANAESVITNILQNDGTLSNLDIRVFVQGSYNARTNVRLDSDVDVCVCLRDTFFTDFSFASSKLLGDYGLVEGGMTYASFKNMVETALVKALGRSGVTRGYKAFDVHANTYRLDADVLPAFSHRRYINPWTAYSEGIEFRPDNGGRVVNWPDQTHENGVSRNNATSRKYKRVIRILKHLRNTMQADSVEAATDFPSFLIECLVWNAPIYCFSIADYTGIVRAVIAETYTATKAQETCNEWGEVNELKYLFRDGQPWTRQQANAFLLAAWTYVGFQ